MPEVQSPPRPASSGLLRELGLLDSTMIVAGSMIGSGIFIVPADIARNVGSPGWLLLTWMITGLLTIGGAVSFGALAARMPHVGGQYAFLRELYSPMWAFLFGWTFFLVIQTGTIAAVAVGFAKYLGVLIPAISPTEYLVPPVQLSDGYAFSLSVQQAVAIAMIVALTAINSQGLRIGRIIQNTFTSTKIVALAALVLVGLVFGWNHEAAARNFGSFWTPAPTNTQTPGLGFAPTVSAVSGIFGLIVALGVSQVGSLFSSDAWNGVTFTAGEVKNPTRTVPRALALGTGLVTVLYVLANLAYMAMLPVEAIQGAKQDRVATAALETVFAGGATIMAVAIVISTFGCNNGLVLSGARVYYAMAKDGLFFRSIARLNRAHVPGAGLWIQGIWASLLVLPLTRKVDAAGAVSYGSLYNNLLDYVIFAVLIFYVLTIGGLFRLRRKISVAPGERLSPGYPLVPILYIAAVVVIAAVLVVYKSETTWPGLLIVLTGIPVFLAWRRRQSPA